MRRARRLLPRMPRMPRRKTSPRPPPNQALMKQGTRQDTTHPKPNLSRVKHRRMITRRMLSRSTHTRQSWHLPNKPEKLQLKKKNRIWNIKNRPKLLEKVMMISMKPLYKLEENIIKQKMT